MESFFLVVHVFLAVGVIALVLMQHGKGADAGAAFGSGASATVFGSRGATSFMAKLTTTFAILFFASSLLLAYIAASRTQAGSILDAVQESTVSAPLVEKPSIKNDLPPLIPVEGSESGVGEQDLPKMK
ncbi:MAG: preprotein translocase subunit SecG [Gammaproteobacteria bacterium]|nr:preprotein translocase subunit SecG [Gammaproteobacteria bacterium]